MGAARGPQRERNFVGAHRDCEKAVINIYFAGNSSHF